MSFQVRDKLTPELRRLSRAVADPRPALAAGGEMLVSLTKRAFADASLRPAPWKPRKSGGTHPLLRKSGNLWQSIAVTGVTKTTVRVGSNAVYAAVQQLGSRKATGRGGGIPARPFFPFLPSGAPTPLAAQRVREVIRDKLANLLRR